MLEFVAVVHILIWHRSSTVPIGPCLGQAPTPRDRLSQHLSPPGGPGRHRRPAAGGALPPDGSTMGNQVAREVLRRAAERQISEEEYEAVREKVLALGLVVKGRGRAGSIALAEGIEGGSRYEAPAAPAWNGRGRAKKEAPAKDFKAVLWAAADRLRAQMDAAEYKHLVLGLIFLKYISDTFVEHQQKVLEMVSNLESDYYLEEEPPSNCRLLKLFPISFGSLILLA